MSWQNIYRRYPRSAFNGVADQLPVAPRPRPGAVAGGLDLRVLELLTARLCHELIGPIAAINNGVELLADEPLLAGGGADQGFVHDAFALVADSAGHRPTVTVAVGEAVKLKPAGSSAGAPPNELAIRFFEGTQITCNYGESIGVLPLDWQRLACNLLLTGAEALSRGGNLVMAAMPDGLDLEATGEFAALSPEANAGLSLATPVAVLTPRSVQAYFTGILAETLGCQLVRTEELRRLRLTVVALAG